MDGEFSARVRSAMQTMAREWFLPESQRRYARFDGPLPICAGQTNSQPWTVAFMLDLLDVQPGQRVLDVGAGSGWTTALLDHLVGPDGTVIGVERVPQVLEFGRANLAAAGLGSVRMEQAIPGVLGWPDEAPYDRILVSAMAKRFPESLAEQLADGGLMVIPVGGTMVKAERRVGRISTSSHGGFRFVPLIE